ncbi:1-aminocyclopropane-1-carboxylate oxidase homolog 1 [Linum perenne]
MASHPHHDPSSFTILLQDQSHNGMLQFFHHQYGWVDVPPIQGALIVIIGNLLQLVSNDKFKSAEHKVLANRTGARVSIACFFRPIIDTETIATKLYGPIPELVTDQNPAIYRKASMLELINYRSSSDSQGQDRHYIMSHFKLQ